MPAQQTKQLTIKHSLLIREKLLQTQHLPMCAKTKVYVFTILCTQLVIPVTIANNSSIMLTITEVYCR